MTEKKIYDTKAALTEPEKKTITQDRDEIEQVMVSLYKAVDDGLVNFNEDEMTEFMIGQLEGLLARVRMRAVGWTWGEVLEWKRLGIAFDMSDATIQSLMTRAVANLNPRVERKEESRIVLLNKPH